MATKRSHNQHLLAHLVREAEKAIICQYIAKHGGNKSHAAEAKVGVVIVGGLV